MKKEVKVGLVVVLAIAFLIYGVNYLRGIDLFKSSRDYYAMYQRVDGLVAASPVQYQGLKVGQVLSTELVEVRPGMMRMVVAFRIDNKVLKLPKDTRARLVSADLFGTKAIDLVPGTSTELLKAGDTLNAEEQLSLQARVDAQIAPVMQKAENLMASLDTMINAISQVLGENADNLEKSIGSFKDITQNIKEFTVKLNTLIDQESGKISSTLSKVDNLASSLSQQTGKIDRTLSNVSAISDTLAAADIGGAIRSAYAAVNNMNDLIAQINNGEGSLGKLIHTDSLHQALVRSGEELARLIENIREHPNRYMHISVFGRKEKGLKLDAQEEKKLKKMLND